MDCATNNGTECMDLLNQAVQTGVDNRYPALPNSLKNLKDSKYRFNINGKMHTLMVIWTDWRAYCLEPSDPNIAANIGNAYSQWNTGDAQIMDLKDKHGTKYNFSVRKAKAKDAVFTVIIDEIIDSIKDIRNNNPEIDDNQIKQILSVRYGFPWTHSTSDFLGFALIPDDNLFRPAIEYNPNMHVKNPFDVNMLDGLIDNATTPTEKYHYTWLKNWYEYMKNAHENLISTRADGRYADSDSDVQGAPYPFTGNGYTSNWDKIEEMDDDPESVYGFTEFIVRSPSLTVNSGGGDQFQAENQVDVYAIEDCVFNDFNNLIEYLDRTDTPLTGINIVKTDKKKIIAIIIAIVIVALIVLIAVLLLTSKNREKLNNNYSYIYKKGIVEKNGSYQKAYL